MTNSDTFADRPLILLTGATGYVGGRLLNVLETAGHRVRCLARRPEFLHAKIAATTEIVQGDLLNRSSLVHALQGVHTVYYLVHSMGSLGAFEEEDRQAARNVADAVRTAGVRRIIYLGGLGDRNDALSSHLRSRHEVGELLCASGAQVIEFRASIVIGSGSLSFEMIRALVERLPVMLTPRWVSTLAQPIAIEDLLHYLLAALQLPLEESRIFEIGGADRVSYGDLMREYARQRGLRRLMISVPVLTPRLSSLWLGLVTPLYARIGRKIVDSMRHPTVVHDDAALRVFSMRPIGVREAITRALLNEDKDFAQTRWSDALSSAKTAGSWGGIRFGTRVMDSRVACVPVSPALAFAPIRCIGGKTGWYYGQWLWKTRGFIDLLLGGVGMRRGRRDPEWVRLGDTLDCWRVEAVEPDRRLRLMAEMKRGRSMSPIRNEKEESSELSMVRVRPQENVASSPDRSLVRGEIALLCAVLEDAIACFESQFVVGNRRARLLATEAERWLFTDEFRWTFSFVNICTVLGLDPASVRRRLTPKDHTSGRLTRRLCRSPVRQPPLLVL